MTNYQIFFTLLIVALVTYLIRLAPFILFPEGRKVPAFIVYLGKNLPTASMALLIIYALKDSFSQPADLWPQAITTLYILLIHSWRRNFLLSVTTATVLYMVLVQVVFKSFA